MAAAEHQRAGAIKGGGEGRGPAAAGRNDRANSAKNSASATSAVRRDRCGAKSSAASAAPPRTAANPARAPPTIAASCANEPGTNATSASAAAAIDGARRVGAEALGHAEHGLGDHRDRHQLKPVQQAGAPPEAGDFCCAVGEGEHQRRRGQGEARPGGETAEPAPARVRPMAKPTWLDAGPGRNWASATRSAKARSSSQPRRVDEFAAEIAEMGDRPAEGR